MNDPAPRDSDRADEAVVDSEWRKIEAERIALEQEEAREDLLDAEPRRRRWPWLALALAAALLAGLVAAAVVNARAKAPKPMTDSAQPPAGVKAQEQPE